MHLPHIRPFAKCPLYFFTACTEERRPLLASQPAFAELTDIWTRSGTHDGWYVGRYVLMPDHVPFFARPTAEARPVSEWHKMWKSVSARTLCREFKLKAPFWQVETFDHILRSMQSYDEKWQYVRENPVRAKLIAGATHWQWQGEINVLEIS